MGNFDYIERSNEAPRPERHNESYVKQQRPEKVERTIEQEYKPGVTKVESRQTARLRGTRKSFVDPMYRDDTYEMEGGRYVGSGVGTGSRYGIGGYASPTGITAQTHYYGTTTGGREREDIGAGLGGFSPTGYGSRGYTENQRRYAEYSSNKGKYMRKESQGSNQYLQAEGRAGERDEQNRRLQIQKEERRAKGLRDEDNSNTDSDDDDDSES